MSTYVPQTRTINGQPLSGDIVISTGGSASLPFFALDAALGNNSTDAGPAIQALLDSANTAGGGEVYIPAGTYLVSQVLEIGSDTHLRLNQGATIKRGSNTINALLINKHDGTTGGYGQARNIRVSGGVWDGNGSVHTSNITIISFGHAENVVVEDTVVTNTVGTWHLIEFNAVRGGRISRCEFSHSLTGTTEYVQLDLAINSGAFPWFGPWDNTPCQDIVIEGCYFHDGLSAGVSAIGSHSATAGYPHSQINIHGNTFRGQFEKAIKPYDWTDLTISGNTIAGNILQGIRWHAAPLSACSGITISGNVISSTATAVQGRGIAVTAGTNAANRKISNITIIGNTVRDTTQYGIGVDWGDGVAIHGNVLSRIGTDTGTGYKVGIWVYKSTRAVVTGNRVTGTNPNGGSGSFVADLAVGETESTFTTDVIVTSNMCDGVLYVKPSTRVLVANNSASAVTVDAAAVNVNRWGNTIGGVYSDIAEGGTGIPAGDVATLDALTQTAYDALGTKDGTTLYLITGA